MEEKPITEKTVEKQQPIRDTLYGRIDVSVKGMDRFIAAMIALLVVLVLAGSAI